MNLSALAVLGGGLRNIQDTEFKGNGKKCQSREIKIIRGVPYYHKLQGESERSHQTWKNKLY